MKYFGDWIKVGGVYHFYGASGDLLSSLPAEQCFTWHETAQLVDDWRAKQETIVPLEEFTKLELTLLEKWRYLSSLKDLASEMAKQSRFTFQASGSCPIASTVIQCSNHNQSAIHQL
jgi:hypothetical protein